MVVGGAARWFDEQFALLLFRPAGPFELLGEKRNGEERGGWPRVDWPPAPKQQNSAKPLTSCGRSGVAVGGEKFWCAEETVHSFGPAREARGERRTAAEEGRASKGAVDKKKIVADVQQRR